MKASVALVSFLATTVWAGGYQNCLERVWHFQAYLIDQLNPPSAQTIGYACDKWDTAAKVCTGSYIPCAPKPPNTGSCNFDEMQRHIGNLSPNMPAQGAYNNGVLDNRQTAINCLRSWRSANRGPFNFKEYRMMKGGRTDHVRFIQRLGQVTNDNYKNSAVRTAAGDDAFRRVDNTLTQITQARVADHGPYLKTAAANGLPGVNVHTKNMGANPFYNAANPGLDSPTWETVDWEGTVRDGANPPDTRDKIRNFLNGYYRGPTANGQARNHWQVLRAFKNTKDRTNRCRK